MSATSFRSPFPLPAGAGRRVRLYRLPLAAAALAGFLCGAAPARAQQLPAQPELSCTGPSTFERWGAGTAFPAKRKPPFKGAGSPFNRRYRILPDQQSVQENMGSGGYYTVEVDGSQQVERSIRPDGFNLRWTFRDRWHYDIDSYSVSRAPSGQFTYRYLQRREDRNNLVFELYKSEGTCRLLNPVGG